MLASRGEAATVGDRDAKVLVGIHGRVVDAYFVVKMWTRRAPTGANETDQIAAAHVLAGCDCETGKVTVACADAVAMVDHNCLAVPAHRLGDSDHTVGRGNDPGAVATSDINPAMECAFTVEWINPFAKAAC